MPPKTAMERLALDDDPTEVQKAPIKVSLSATFEGTLDQFNTWIAETFRNPEFLQLKVQIGPSITGQIPLPVQPQVIPVQTLTSGPLLEAAITDLTTCFPCQSGTATTIIERAMTMYTRHGMPEALKSLTGDGLTKEGAKIVAKHFAALAVRPAS